VKPGANPNPPPAELERSREKALRGRGYGGGAVPTAGSSLSEKQSGPVVFWTLATAWTNLPQVSIDETNKPMKERDSVRGSREKEKMQTMGFGERVGWG